MRNNDILEAYFPCMKLINTSSRLEKESILRENKDNKPFKEVLKYLLDNMRISGISEKDSVRKLTFCFLMLLMI